MAHFTPENPPPNHYPVTGFCIIASPEKCPTGYNTILKTQDDQADACLGAGSFFSQRPLRYVCFTRFFPLADGRLNNVMVETTLINERDPIPPQYTVVDRTLDTGEKALQKKQLIAKMAARHSVAEAINDLVVISGRKPPTGYTMAGEVSGLSLCFRKGLVPEESRFTGMLDSQDLINAGRSTSVKTGISPAILKYTNSVQAQTGDSLLRHSASGRALMQQQSAPGNPVDDIPFQLAMDPNAIGKNLANFMMPDIPTKTLADLEREYYYDFSLERTVISAARDSVT